MSKTIFNGSLFDILPVPWKTEEAEAISFALDWAAHRILELAKRTRIRVDINDLSERTLDVMAQEMRAPYYAQDLPIDTKRAIIRHTIRWYMHAGTPSAVTELMEVVYDEGAVIENWEFEDGPGEPYTFDVETGAPSRPDTRATLLNTIDRVKNVRSWLRRIIYLRTIEMTLGVGHGLSGAPNDWSWGGHAGDHDIVADAGVALGIDGTPDRYSGGRDEAWHALAAQLHAGAGLEGHSQRAAGRGRETEQRLAAQFRTAMNIRAAPQSSGQRISEASRDVPMETRAAIQIRAVPDAGSVGRAPIERRASAPLPAAAALASNKCSGRGDAAPLTRNIPVHRGSATALFSCPSSAGGRGDMLADVSMSAPVQRGSGAASAQTNTGG